MPTSTRRKRPFYGGFPANPCRFPIFYRRGGRLCPPAGNARFHGNPMRIRNISMGGQSRPPLQRVLKTTRVRQKSPRLPFRTRTGRCGHRPLQITTKNQRISRADRAARPYKRDTIDRLYHRIPYIKYRPCRNISGARNRPILQTSGVFVKFIFHAVGVDAHIDPQETAVLWRFSGEPVPISHFAP